MVELERLIGSLVEQAHAETYRRLASVLTPAVEGQLDALLRVDEAVGRTATAGCCNRPRVAPPLLSAPPSTNGGSYRNSAPTSGT
ncbi:hypothetical protein [Hymenobacter sp. BRD67]|uniref:hypothetical protein n=1 Tax=Hymenobacter sp. BRD67 TaxID=2675877 RepID=UPI0015670B65|nr:hypothetical protein [Hymenobacter sp. BRD67]QKG55069.1 hypothetical protein GKZ67_21845 [Hymenobacter sp. BRD67]